MNNSKIDNTATDDTVTDTAITDNSLTDNNSTAISPVKNTLCKKPKGTNASLELNYTGKKSEIGDIVRSSAKYFSTPAVKTDEECAERLDDFFQRVSDGDEFPTVEKMCLCLGVTRQTVNRWENGDTNCSSLRCDMVKKAKAIMGSIDAELVQKNKIPQITYIFRAKNFYDMADKQEVILTPNNPLGDGASEDDIAKRLLETK